jgi:hypothetical protein
LGTSQLSWRYALLREVGEATFVSWQFAFARRQPGDYSSPRLKKHRKMPMTR